MPATGTIARTVTNIKSGGTSPISGLVHSLTLVLIVFFLGHLATEIPLACLSAILIYVAWNMGDWVHLRQIRQRPFSDQVSLVMVFILTVVCNLALAIGFGLCWALFNYWFKQHKTKLL
jgi:SulP family sulfate permease